MKKKHSKKAGNKPGLLTDMEKITSDPRFKNIGSNPMLRYMPKEKARIKIDDRFSSLKTDSKFYEKITMDPRGKKGNFSTKDDLNRFYTMSASESSCEDDNDEEDSDVDGDEDSDDDVDGDEDSNDDDESKEKVIRKKVKTKRKPKTYKVSDDDSDEGTEEIKSLKSKEVIPTTSSSPEIKNGAADSEDEETIPDDIKEQLLQYDFSRGEMEFTDSSNDDSSSSDEGDDTEAPGDEFEWGELDKDAIWDGEDQEVEETNRFAVCNMNWDRIKAVDLLLLFSSSLPAGGKIDSVQIYLSQYGKERLDEENKSGPQELVQSTSGGSDDHLKHLKKLEKGQLSKDSGGTSKGHLEAVRRYQRNRLKYYYAVVECDSVSTSTHVHKECDRTGFEGSGTMIDLRYIPDDMTFDEEPVDTSEKIPKNYTVKDFTTSALHDSIPLMTWDETAAERKKDLSTVMNQITKGDQPDYERLEAYIASNSDDETSDEEIVKHKNETAQKFKRLLQEIDETQKKKDEHKLMFDDTLKPKEDKLNNKEEPINADHESSDGDEDSHQSEEESNTDAEESLDNSMQQDVANCEDSKVSEFLSDVTNMQQREHRKKHKTDVDKVETFELPTEETKKPNKEKKTQQKLTPFEEFLEKRKHKRQDKIKQKNKKSESGEDATGDEESEEDNAISDDEIPEGVEDLMDDPFFAEELQQNKKDNTTKQNKLKKGKKKSKIPEEADKGNLALLIMDEEEAEKKHFSMRQIIEESKQTKKKKGRFMKKKSKKEIEEEREKKKEAHKFEVDLDSRFSNLATSSDYHIDPTHSSFKKTDAMQQIIHKVQNKRILNTDNEDLIPHKKPCNLDLRNDAEVNNIIKKLKHKTKNKR